MARYSIDVWLEGSASPSTVDFEDFDELDREYGKLTEALVQPDGKRWLVCGAGCYRIDAITAVKATHSW